MLEYGYNEKNKILLALTLTKNVGTAKILGIIEGVDGFGSLNAKLISQFLSENEFKEFEIIYSEIHKEIEYLQAFQIGIFSYLDSFFPEQLKLLPDPPIILYFKGAYLFKDLGEFFSKERLGVVGSRKILNQTKSLINNLLQSFEGSGIVSVSGLAYGVDAELHSSSLNYNIPTIAVVASGVNFPSPAGNAKLYNQIISKGLVISECFPKKSIAPGNFAHRNRIVAALSDVLLVAQAAKDSGSVITPRLAFPIGVKIFAATSNYDDENFQGCHELISEGIAKIYLSPFTLGKHFGIDVTRKSDYSLLSANEKLIISYINKYKSVSLEEIVFGCEVQREELMKVLMSLTLDDYISTDMNGFYYLK